MTDRYASLHRQTRETDVTLELSLDGGERKISTGVGFFDHMLTAFAVHGQFGLNVKTIGDWEVEAKAALLADPEGARARADRAYARLCGRFTWQAVFATMMEVARNAKS